MTVSVPLGHDRLVAVGLFRRQLGQEQVARHGAQRGGDPLAADPVGREDPRGQPLPHAARAHRPSRCLARTADHAQGGQRGQPGQHEDVARQQLQAVPVELVVPRLVAAWRSRSRARTRTARPGSARPGTDPRTAATRRTPAPARLPPPTTRPGRRRAPARPGEPAARCPARPRPSGDPRSAGTPAARSARRPASRPPGARRGTARPRRPARPPRPGWPPRSTERSRTSRCRPAGSATPRSDWLPRVPRNTIRLAFRNSRCHQ